MATKTKGKAQTPDDGSSKVSKTQTPSSEAKTKGRSFTLTLKPLVGHIHDFSALIDGDVVIAGEDGTTERSFDGEIAAAPVNVVIWTTGIAGSKYQISIDLPGKVNDFSLTQTMGGGLQKVEFDV